MAGEGASGASHDGDLPEPVREWLARIAAERGVSERELLGQLVSDDDLGPPRRAPAEVLERLDALADELDAADDRVDAVESSVEEVRDDFERKIDDVRERVIQVKREADAKADADHEHEALEAELDALRGELDAVLADVDDLRADLEALDDRVSTGFENFRSVLEYLTETTDELDGKFDRLAEAVLADRRRVRSLAAAGAERAAVADLAAEANRHGIRSAVCGSCDETVEVGLLSEPRCPHCDAGFRAIEPKQGFFGTTRLLTGKVPALEGDVAGAPDEDLASIVEEDAPAAAPGEVADMGTVGSSGGDPDAGDADEASVPDRAADEPDGPDDDPVTEESAPEGDDAGAGDVGQDDDSSGVDAADSTGGEPDEDDADGRSLQAIDGVGPAYADRLRNAGMASVEDLVEADPEDVADAADVSPARTDRWIGRAREMLDD